MSQPNTINCPACEYENALPLANYRCVSCGAKVTSLAEQTGHSMRASEAEPYRQDGFNALWFGISLVVIAVLTAAVLVGVPSVIHAFDFEGQAGILVAIPLWFVSGFMVGLISPNRTFWEPTLACIAVALPTALLLHQGQTVKTMPIFMYALYAALGVLFCLLGTYAGERVQSGPPQTVQGH